MGWPGRGLIGSTGRARQRHPGRRRRRRQTLRRRGERPLPLQRGRRQRPDHRRDRGGRNQHPALRQRHHPRQPQAPDRQQHGLRHQHRRRPGHPAHERRCRYHQRPGQPHLRCRIHRHRATAIRGWKLDLLGRLPQAGAGPARCGIRRDRAGQQLRRPAFRRRRQLAGGQRGFGHLQRGHRGRRADGRWVKR